MNGSTYLGGGLPAPGAGDEGGDQERTELLAEGRFDCDQREDVGQRGDLESIDVAQDNGASATSLIPLRQNALTGAWAEPDCAVPCMGNLYADTN